MTTGDDSDQQLLGLEASSHRQPHKHSNSLSIDNEQQSLSRQ